MKHRLRGLFIRQNPRPLELKIALPAKSTLMQIQKSPCLQASKEWQSVLYGWSREEMNKTWSKTRRQIARLSNCVLIQTTLMSHLSSENVSSHSWLKKSAVWWKNRDLDNKCHKLEALDWKKKLVSMWSLRLGCFKVSLICMSCQTLGKMVTHLTRLSTTIWKQQLCPYE